MHLLLRSCLLLFCIACLNVLADTAGAGTAAVESTDAKNLEAREARIDRLTLTDQYVDAFSEGVEVLRERLAINGSRAPETLDALRRVALALEEMGDRELSEALWYIYQELSIQAVEPCHPRIAESILELGPTNGSINCGTGMSRYDGMPSMLDVDAPEQRILVARVVRACGNYFRRRDNTRSIALYEEAIAILEQGDEAALIVAARTRAWLGWMLLHVGHHDEARKELTRALAELSAYGLGETSTAGTVESALADLDALAGDWPAAERGYKRALRYFVDARRVGSTRFADTPVHGYNLLALAQLKQGKYREAWDSLQRGRGQTTELLAYLSGVGRDSPSSLEEIRRLRNRVVSARGLRRYMSASRDPADVNWVDVLDELDANAQLFDLEARLFAPHVADAVSLEELQSELPENWAYTGALDARIGNELFASESPIIDSRWNYVVRSTGGIQWVPVWEFKTEPEYDAKYKGANTCAQLILRAANWRLRIDDDIRLTRLARENCALEFDPVLNYLAGVDQVVAEFGGDAGPIGLIADSSGRFAGGAFVISYSPSADAFVTCRRRTAVGSGVVAIGDPVYSSGDSPLVSNEDGIGPIRHAGSIDIAQHRAAVNGDLAALNSLPRLLYAAREIDGLRRWFPRCATFTRDQATEATVNRIFRSPQCPDLQIVHFATHALSDSPVRHRSSLAMSRIGVDGDAENDGLIDALEIELSWSFSADLVTLSGCQTMSGFSWGEPLGLAGVFLAVGAKSVVASLWKVDDQATALLMDRFYQNLSGANHHVSDGRDSEPIPKAVALAEAKSWLRNYTDAADKKVFAHPVYWAGFILIGDPD